MNVGACPAALAIGEPPSLRKTNAAGGGREPVDVGRVAVGRKQRAVDGIVEIGAGGRALDAENPSPRLLVETDLTAAENAARILVKLGAEKRGAKRADFQAFAKAKGAADLMVPGEVLVVDKVPVLGSGKLDYVGVAALVRDMLAKDVAAVA